MQTTNCSAIDRTISASYGKGMDYQQIITIEPGKRGGKPCIRGMRIAVSDVLDYLAGGMAQEQILADFPELTADDIRACLDSRGYHSRETPY
jgi:uncharacterized protein (DUF433 family)